MLEHGELHRGIVGELHQFVLLVGKTHLNQLIGRNAKKELHVSHIREDA